MPTRDIHLKQLDLEETWLEFLEQFVMPLQEVAFEGYASEVGFLLFLCNSTFARFSPSN